MRLRAMPLLALALGASGCGEELCADAQGGFDPSDSGDATEVRAGQGIACARHAGGRVSCWGSFVGEPAVVPGISSAASLTINGAYDYFHNYAVLESGEVYFWSVGDSALEFGVDGAMRFLAYAAGPSAEDYVSCIMASGGRERPRGWVTCTSADGSLYRDGPVLRDFSTNGMDYCSVDETGVADCRGRYVDFGGLSGVEQISVGYPACVRLTTGEVACWESEIVGDPTLLEGIDDAVDISSGSGHACAVRATGRVTCWGTNEYGELGTGQRDDGDEWGTPQPPADVEDLDDAVQVTAGDDHTCALRSTGSVVCWGDAFPHEGRDDCFAVSRPSTVTLPDP